MKVFFTIVLIILTSTQLFAQSFYKYQGKKVNLSIDSTMYVIRTDNELADKQSFILEKQLQEGQIKSFQNWSDNRFLVVGNAKIGIENNGYFSNVYRNEKNEMLFVLPRIVLMLKKNQSLEAILSKYKGKLILESGGKQNYILKCNVAKSEELLRLVNELDSREDVVWCEPEFFSEHKMQNPLYPQQYYLKTRGRMEVPLTLT